MINPQINNLFFKTIAVYDLKTNEYITIPVFKKAATLAEKDSTFKSFAQKTKGFLLDKLKASDNQLFEAYLNYTNMVLGKYYELKTPKWFSSKNVIIEGDPSVGKFITFTLNTPQKICKCYFVSGKSSLTKCWSEHFSKINKLDNTNWYYEITDNKEFEE
ncbi:hypothetical protein [Arcticibacter eurypsychrophilus]|uniref:hypothetical protein n=1 Tax=Arcticibacter eurypsychrophilus TaxID=1434752 RepID=UPI001112D5B1|nr:hypothetical protein [Arcticibacter eurypsychrophilus]